ncbi:MAG: MBL fold metallo-hydrolase [Thiohalocapsa sp.]
MSHLDLRFLGVGNSQALTLGSSSAVLEADDDPWLLLDCGPRTLESYLVHYQVLPEALFITHAHFDHIGGLEGLYYRLATAADASASVRMYVPVPLIPVLQRRLADYPNLLAEGGSNFWDVFQLIPVSENFWHRDWQFTVFPVRHHEHLSAFGLSLEGVFLYSGDTRPIPEVINRYAKRGEWIFHDCCSVPNPSHTGVGDIRAEYKPEQWQRMVLYHYESEQAGALIENQGLRIVRRGQRFDLDQRPPLTTKETCGAGVQRLPGAVGW